MLNKHINYKYIGFLLNKNNKSCYDGRCFTYVVKYNNSIRFGASNQLYNRFQSYNNIYGDAEILKITEHKNDILSPYNKNLVDFMMKFELGLEKPNINRARNSAITIGTAYVVGGLIPLLPYVFVTNVQKGLLYSSVVTLMSLFLFGYFKSRAMGQNPLYGAIKIMGIGSLAAGAAYFAAQFFEKLF